VAFHAFGIEGKTMRILMLGWEFPPYISGGLGTACLGLTKALSQRGAAITFVLPKPIDGEYASHVKLLTPQTDPTGQTPRTAGEVASTFRFASSSGDGHPTAADKKDQPNPSRQSAAPGDLPGVTFKAVPAQFRSPYPGGGAVGEPAHTDGRYLTTLSQPPNAATVSGATRVLGGAGTHQGHDTPTPPANTLYDGDMLLQARRYADLCVDLLRDGAFDVIPAHDWLTFPAAAAVARATGKPWIAHIHSTEHDRAGGQVDPQIIEIERNGVQDATRVIAVSEMTRRILTDRYDLPADKCEVVYNGVAQDAPEAGKEEQPIQPPAGITKGDKVALFLGRVTVQKGPEYFIAAARKVLEKMDNVKFVIAGSGDQVPELMEKAARAGIADKVTFTGFLHSDEVERIYAMADVFVMPSVSEPFGIAPLEAMTHDVPVIISKTSGVSEVVKHALKVDFWDTHDIANKIIAVLRHPPLSKTLREHADLEVRELTWDGAAERCEQVYAGLA